MTRAVGSKTSVIARQEFVWGTTDISATNIANHLLPVRDCSLTSSMNNFQSDTIDATRAVLGLGNGNRAVQGSISMDLYPEGLELFFKYLLGDTATTTGSGTFTHVIKGTANTMEGLTIEKGFTNIDQYFLYNGCRINSMTIDIVQEGFHGVTFDFVGKSELVTQVSDTNLSSSVQISTSDGMTGYNATVTVDSGLQNNVKSGNINITNNIETDGYVLGSQFRASAEYSKRECSGEFTMFFEDADLYESYILGTEVPIVFNFTDGSGKSLNINFPAVKLSGDAPSINSTSGVDLTMKFNAKYDSSEATDVIFTIVNEQATVEPAPDA